MGTAGGHHDERPDAPVLTRVGRPGSPMAWAPLPARSFRIPGSPTGGPSGPTMKVEVDGREQGSEMRERGGQNPDGNRSVESGAWKEAGAHLDCGRSAEAPRAGRPPGRRRAAGALGHSAPGPGSHAAGTAPCHWRDMAPRREGRPLALPNTHSAQHPGPPAAQCPRLRPGQPGPPAAAAPDTLCSFTDSSAFGALIPLGWLAL